MACAHADLGNGVVLSICRPDGEYAPVPNRRRRRFWCFKCRKRSMHILMRFSHVQPSWYEDWLQWNCPTCNGDYRSFPGF